MLKCALSDGVYCFSRYGEKRGMGAKPGSVLPTVASKKGILYHSLVKRSNTSAFHVDGTGSNPVGVTICPLLLTG